MENGKIHVYYGYGKGKTTAAMGQAFRAAGSGLRVLLHQFLKDNSSGERKALEKIPEITCLAGKDSVKFCSQMSDAEKKKLRQYNEGILEKIAESCGGYDVLLLDESLCAVRLGVLDEARLVRFLEQKPRRLEVILTGHEASGQILRLADYATEMRKIKHPYDNGLPARKGIEY